MTLRLVYNSTDTPAVVDELGHFLGGGEWGSVESTDPVSRRLLADGILVEPAELPAKMPEYEMNGRFVRARKQHKDRKQRQDRLDNKPKDELRELADTADLPVDDDAHKRELVEAIATSDVEIPTSKGGRSRSTRKET